MDNPRVVTPEEWLAARKDLLAREKEATRAKDAVDAARRALPMTEVTKDYTFTGRGGQVSLADLFDGRRQLITYHFILLRRVRVSRRGSGLSDLLVPGRWHR